MWLQRRLCAAAFSLIVLSVNVQSTNRNNLREETLRRGSNIKSPLNETANAAAAVSFAGLAAPAAAAAEAKEAAEMIAATENNGVVGLYNSSSSLAFIQHHSAAATATAATAATAAAAAATSAAAASKAARQAANPWQTDPELKAFMGKFNIPERHGSGVYVDLGKTGSGYRQVGGFCPVFGKYIQLQKSGATTQTFLQNFPVGGSSARPLPGGFNLAYVSNTGRSFSPVTDAFLVDAFGASGPKHPISRCARYASLLEPMKPGSNKQIDYKLPFVFDSSSNKCYVLHVSMQKLKGSRYCSTFNSPAGLIWPCFYPNKSAEESASLVYGSGYIGAANGNDFDYWRTHCPTKAVKDALFGVWSEGSCIPFTSSSAGVYTTQVNKKSSCWEEVFKSSASDEAVATNPTNWDSVWPTLDSAASLSGGYGYNYANYIPRGVSSGGSCIIFKQTPDCFIKSAGSTAYTAIGDIEEEHLPQKTNTSTEGGNGGGGGTAGGETAGGETGGGETDKETGGGETDQDANKEQDNKPPTEEIDEAEEITQPETDTNDEETKPSPPPEGAEGIHEEEKTESDEGNKWLLAGGIVGGLIILAAVAAGAVYYTKKPPAHATQESPTHIEGETGGGAAGRTPSEANVNLEESFWRGEGEGLIDAEYENK